MIYLSSTTQVPLGEHFGLMLSSRKAIGGWEKALSDDIPWMLDNGAFTQGFDAKIWIKSLLKYLKWKDTCLGIVIPDVVGNALATMQMYSHYHRIAKEIGYPVAFVSQDGITPDLVPWDSLDVLFVGGTNNHKLFKEAGAVIAEAKANNKWVHVGRVNSSKRIRQFYMADSVDGTTLNISAGDERHQKVRRFTVAIEYCNNKKKGLINHNGQHTMELEDKVSPENLESLLHILREYYDDPMIVDEPSDKEVVDYLNTDAILISVGSEVRTLHLEEQQAAFEEMYVREKYV